MLQNLMNLTLRYGPAMVALGLITSVRAESVADRFRENEQKQEQLAGEARNLMAGLDVMLGEYERNGLAGEDVAVVQRLKAAIANLGGPEMRQVVDLLQRARAVQVPGVSAKTAADAFSAQKQIVVAIQKIIAEHTRQQEAQQLARQLNDLADRQARNLQNGIELGRLTGPSKPENFAAILQAQLETQRGEQQAIAAELKVVTQAVQKFAANPENADLAERFRSGARQLDQLQPKAEQAEASLRAGQLFKAVADEKLNRDELRKISREIAPRERGPAALRQAERELTEVITEQEQLMADTARQKADTDFAKWIEERMADIDPNRTLAGEFRRLTPAQRLQSPELRAKFDAVQQAKGTELAKLEDQQGELAGKADHVGQMVPEVAEAAEQLKKAGVAMQEARNAMQEANAPAAQQQQADAIRQLQAARQELQRKAEEAELLAANSGDKIKDLERLRAAVENMAKQEEAMAKAAQPNAAQQANLAKRAAQIAPRAAELAPSAAPAMQQGAAHAENARAAMAQNQNEPARQQAAQAAQQLARAAQQIAQELANAQQAAEQRQQAEAALAELAKLIEAEQKLDLSTAKVMSAKDAAALLALALEQAEIEKQTTTFKASLAGGMISAVSPLNEAENAMQEAQVVLKKSDGTAARAAEALAIARLFDAQANINRAAQAAQQALGQQFESPDAMARAANQIAQAMQEVNGAQANLQQAAQQMGQEMAQNAAQAAMEAAQAAQQAAQAAQAAQQQAQQAGNQPAANPAGAAAQSAQQAAQAAQQAAQNAQQIASQNPQMAVQNAQQAAQQAGQAAQSAQQAAASAQQSQQAAQGAGQNPANQAAAQQAASAMQSAQQAAAAAQRAQQLANAAAKAAQNGQQAAGQSTQQAAGQLAQAAMQATQAAAQQAGSPAMQQAMQQAAQQLANAANQAMNSQNQSAQQAAQQAAQQLAQAAGQMQAMQAGISQPSAGQMPGQGKGQGQMPGQGMQGAGRQPGQGQGSGPTAQNQGPSEGATGYKPGGEPEAVQRAARETALRNSGFLGLPPRERAAIQQSLGEKYPQEFAPLVEQYLLNLANEPAKPAAR